MRLHMREDAMHPNRVRRFGLAAILVLVAVAGGAGQERPAEFDGYIVPGWSFTPGVSISGGWD